MPTAAVILAAGSGSRFGEPGAKLVAPFRGKPLVNHAVSAASGAGFDEIVVVEGAVALEAIVPDSVTLLHTADWRSGAATSLRVAVDWCQRAGHDAMVVGLADQPSVTTEHWVAVGQTGQGEGDDSMMRVATFRSRHGYPVRVPAALWPLLPIDGELGLEAVIARHSELVTEVAFAGRLVDVDTQEDLRRWQ